MGLNFALSPLVKIWRFQENLERPDVDIGNKLFSPIKSQDNNNELFADHPVCFMYQNENGLPENPNDNFGKIEDQLLTHQNSDEIYHKSTLQKIFQEPMEEDQKILFEEKGNWGKSSYLRQPVASGQKPPASKLHSDKLPSAYKLAQKHKILQKNSDNK